MLERLSKRKTREFLRQTKTHLTCLGFKMVKEARFKLFQSTDLPYVWTLSGPHIETDENLHAKPEVFGFENTSSF
jgi:hypothetical protein